MIDLSLYNNVFVDSFLDEAIQEIDILFSTYNTELIGEPYFGANFEQFLWSLTTEEDEIRAYIIEKIENTLYASRTDYSVDVQFFNSGNIDPFYYVIITLKYDGEEISKTYQLSN